SRKQLAIGKHRVPWPDYVLDEDARLIERVGLQESLRLFLRRRLVNDERAKVVGERPRGRELPLVLQAGEILPMHGPHLGDLGFVLNVLHDGGEFHGCAPLGSVKAVLGWVRCTASASMPNRPNVKARSLARVQRQNGSAAM